MVEDISVTPAQWLAKQIETGDPHLSRSMVKTMAEALMSAWESAADVGVLSWENGRTGQDESSARE